MIKNCSRAKKPEKKISTQKYEMVKVKRVNNFKRMKTKPNEPTIKIKCYDVKLNNL